MEASAKGGADWTVGGAAVPGSLWLRRGFSKEFHLFNLTFINRKFYPF